MTVIVAGAGIGGLVAGLSLAQASVDVRIFEAVRKIEPVGVGINILPHAVRELFELGLEKQLLAAGVQTAALAYFSKRGQEIWREPRGRAAGYNWPQISINRGTLQQILLDAAMERLGPERIATGHQLVDWRETGGIEATFLRREDNERVKVSGNLLIGADGINSTVRAKLYSDEGPPIWNGAVLWRGVTRGRAILDNRSMIMAGHEFQKFVCYPIAPQQAGEPVINWIAELKFEPGHVWRREDWNRKGDFADFLPQFESWRFGWLDVPELVHASGGCFEYPMVDRDPLPKWTHGRATLLGDAAHAMYPIGSNGASQAILDARVLAREIRARGEVPEALEAYETERRPATSAIVLANRRNGPEQVMQLVEERAPQGFARIGDVLAREELEDVAASYKKVAGFTIAELNARPPILGST
ncbi:flavin-dependent oxidoreductase [Hyphomonas sp.]|uniref:flavin-dependent oxidoreductase n=1 Tax=Hyphomonas sp. TaxID=87 RepID=UPI0025B8013C|nr:flavin-dependent oxidoreductase [Hyphomonas sp.]